METQKNIKNSAQEEQQAPEVQENNSKQEEKKETQNCELCLIVQDKPSNAETRYVLEEGKEIVVGASPECSVIVSDPYISGHHFSIKVENGRIEVRDLGSKNGLYLMLDGPVEVVPEQALLAGKTVFKLERAGNEEQ